MGCRVVVDTNVFVGAMLNTKSGSNREVLRRCLQGKIQPLIGAALFHEYEDLLDRDQPLAKSPLSPDERRELFAAFLSVCEWIKVYYLWRPHLPDEGDNHLVELAVAGGAEVVITHNVKHLRHGELRFPELRVMTPSQFIKSQ